MTDSKNLEEITCQQPGVTGPQSIRVWLSRRLIPILSLLFIVALVVGIFILNRDYPHLIEGLQRYGYLGAFLISIALNATLVLPAGNFLILAALGATLPSATFVGLMGGLGAAIGESTGYIAGYSGRAMVSQQKMYGRIETWMKRYGFWALFVLSAAPLVFDLAGIAAGACRYKYWKFFLACWLGRSVLYVSIAWAGLRGWEWLLNLAG